MQLVLCVYLGKTIQCISAVSYLVEQGVPGPFLVCAPLSTVPNWVSEFQRFAPLVSIKQGACLISVLNK